MDGYPHGTRAERAIAGGQSASAGRVRPVASSWLSIWLLAALSAWLLPWPSPVTAATAPLDWLNDVRRFLVALTGAPGGLLSLALLTATGLLVMGFNWHVSRFDRMAGPDRACFRMRWYGRGLIYALAILSGLTWTLGQAHRFRQHVLTAHQRFDLVVVGRVVGLPQMRHHHLRFALEVERAHWVDADRKDLPLPSGSRILLNRYGQAHGRDQWIGSGRTYRMTVRLKPPHATANPGGFDYRRWLFRHRYVATGYVRGQVETLADSPAGWLGRLRADLRARLLRQVHALTARGLLLGLTLGDRSYLPQQDWSVLLATGTNHLLAISGLHVGMIAGLFALIVGGLWRRTRWCEGVPAQRVAAIAALIVAWLYALIAGLSIPTERAAIMLTVMLAGVLFARRWRLFDLWLLAAVLILLVDPFAPLDAGFWLSFLAVLAIIVWVRTRPEAPLWRRLVELQLILTLALWPLVWGVFGRIAWGAVPANLLAVPLVSWLVTPLALLTLVTAPFSTVLSGLLAQAVGWLGRGLFWWLGLLAGHLPDTHQIAPPPPWLVLAFVGVMLLLLPTRWPRRWLGLMLLLPVLLYRPPQPSAGMAVVRLFDLDHGTACLVRTRHHALLYTDGSIATDRVRSALRSLGVQHLDGILMRQVTPHQQRRWLALIAALSGQGASMRGQCSSPVSWYWDRVRFTTWPVVSGHDRGCVVTVQDRYGRTMLAGDLDAATAAVLARSGVAPVDWLVVPHHGDLDASPKMLVQKLRPSAALISAGYLNRFGYPDPTTLARYRAFQARTYVTARTGALRIESGEVTGWRSRQWPFAWRGWVVQHKKRPAS